MKLLSVLEMSRMIASGKIIEAAKIKPNKIPKFQQRLQDQIILLIAKAMEQQQAQVDLVAKNKDICISLESNKQLCDDIEKWLGARNFLLTHEGMFQFIISWKIQEL